jgi:hypothetical protein
VIVAILGLASAAITQTSLAQPGDGSVFERMIAGAALLVLAAWSPFGLLRLIPMMELAAGSVVGQRAALAGAAGSAGIHSPASYMRQAIDRQSRASTSTDHFGPPRPLYQSSTATGAAESGSRPASGAHTTAETDATSTGTSRQTTVRTETSAPPARDSDRAPSRRSAAPEPRPEHESAATPRPPRRRPPAPPREEA